MPPSFSLCASVENWAAHLNVRRFTGSALCQPLETAESAGKYGLVNVSTLKHPAGGEIRIGYRHDPVVLVGRWYSFSRL